MIFSGNYIFPFGQLNCLSQYTLFAWKPYPSSSYAIKIQMSDIKMIFLKYESGRYYTTSNRKSTMLLIILKQQWLDMTHPDKVSGDSLGRFFIFVMIDALFIICFTSCYSEYRVLPLNNQCTQVLKARLLWFVIMHFV